MSVKFITESNSVYMFNDSGTRLLERASDHGMSSRDKDRTIPFPADVNVLRGWPPQVGRGVHFEIAGVIVSTGAVREVL